MPWSHLHPELYHTVTSNAHTAPNPAFLRPDHATSVSDYKFQPLFHSSTAGEGSLFYAITVVTLCFSHPPTPYSEISSVIAILMVRSVCYVYIIL